MKLSLKSAIGIGMSLMLLLLTGCHTVGDKSMSITTIYGATAVLSLLVLLLYAVTIRQKNSWYTLLFSAIPVVNIGYLWLSCAPTLESALWANRLSYLGSVFLPFAMLMIILNATNITYKRILPWVLFGTAMVIFLIAASPGVSDLYYKDMTLEFVNGVSMLDKTYGILHPLYLVYLLGYFASMIAMIVASAVKKTVATPAHAVLVAMAVFVNIGVWLGGQLVKIDFEFLSISYIISELFLLGLQYLIQESSKTAPAAATVTTVDAPSVREAELTLFSRNLLTLTRTEKKVYELYIDGKTTKEVLDILNITENTLKYHNKNIYSKLGVSSRKQLREIAAMIADT